MKIELETAIIRVRFGGMTVGWIQPSDRPILDRDAWRIVDDRTERIVGRARNIRRARRLAKRYVRQRIFTALAGA